ncbi:hypothetical protein ACWGDT_42810 [Streptomyces avermitilis]
MSPVVVVGVGPVGMSAALGPQRAVAVLAPVVPCRGAWLEHAPYGSRNGSPASAGRKYWEEPR